MLVQKAISTKKLAISIAIIFFMIGGTGFMLYQNKKLTANKSAKVNAPMVFNNAVPGAGATASSSALGAGGVNNQAAAEPGQALNINKINQGGGLNLNIFSSDKFKNLRANTFLIKEQPEVGKRDPFKPN